MKPKNTFSKSAGFRQVIVLVGVMLAFTITSFALTSAARNEDGDGKATISVKLRQKNAVTLAFSGSFDTETNKDTNPLEGFRFAFTGKDERLEFPFVRTGHWGDDKIMFHEIFRDETVKPGFYHAMNVRDGSIGIITPISIDEKRQVKISDLTDLVPQRNK